MKTYNVILTKSYIVRIKSNNEADAKEFCELFTGDIQDISTNKYKQKFNFEIENIKCEVNQTFGAEEISEDNF